MGVCSGEGTVALLSVEPAGFGVVFLCSPAFCDSHTRIGTPGGTQLLSGLQRPSWEVALWTNRDNERSLQLCSVS